MSTVVNIFNHNILKTGSVSVVKLKRGMVPTQSSLLERAKLGSLDTWSSRETFPVVAKSQSHTDDQRKCCSSSLDVVFLNLHLTGGGSKLLPQQMQLSLAKQGPAYVTILLNFTEQVYLEVMICKFILVVPVSNFNRNTRYTEKGISWFS
jgi:hypothetical protein